MSTELFNTDITSCAKVAIRDYFSHKQQIDPADIVKLQSRLYDIFDIPVESRMLTQFKYDPEITEVQKNRTSNLYFSNLHRFLKALIQNQFNADDLESIAKRIFGLGVITHSRDSIRATTESLRIKLQEAFDDAAFAKEM